MELYHTLSGIVRTALYVRLDKRLQGYLLPGLFVSDDFGLKPLTPAAPEDMYNIINERYQRGSILLTSLSCRTDRAIVPQWSGPTCSAIHCSPLPGWIASPITPKSRAVHGAKS